VNPKAIRSAEWLVAILVSALVLFLLFIRATHAGGLWRDECDSVELARLPTFADVLHNLKFTSFPILFPATVRLFTNLLGAGAASLRALGFIIATAALIAGWFNSRINNHDVPLLLPALLGLNVTFLIDGTWIRGYGLGGLFIVLAVAVTWLFVAKPRISRLIAMLIVYLAGMQSLVFDAALFPALLAGAFFVCIFRREWKWALGLCLVGLVCAISYLPEFLTYREIKAWTVLLRYPISPGLLWHEFEVACGQPVPLIAGTWLLVVAVSIVGALFCWRRSSSRDLLLFGLLAILIAVTTYYAFLGISHTAPQTRYHLAILFFLAAIAELTIAALCQLHRWLRIARLIFAVVLAISLPFLAWPKITERETTIDLLAKNLQRYAMPDDLIIVNPWFLGPSFSWNYHGQTRWMTLPELSEKRIHRYDLVKAKMEQSDAIADLREAISRTLQAGNRVWLLGGAQPSTEEGPLFLAPAPDPVFGWSSQAYTYAWSMQIGAFVGKHVVEGEVVIAPAKNISPNENIPLLIARGWHE
jgi:hypothetical protein